MTGSRLKLRRTEPTTGQDGERPAPSGAEGSSHDPLGAPHPQVVLLLERQTELLEEIALAVSGKDRQPTAAELIQATREIRDLIGSVVGSDVVQGLLALRGRKTLLRLLLGVLPTHTAAELLPGTAADNERTLRKRLGAVSDKLGNRGGVVVIDHLRAALRGGDGDEHATNKRPAGGVTGALKRSTLFD